MGKFVPFEIAQQCLLTHLNTRRGNNDESPVAVDIDFTIEDLPAKAVAAALRTDVADVIRAFFADDEEQNRRFLGIGSIPLDEEWEGKHQVKISSLAKLRCAKLRKIKFRPIAKGLFEGSFQVTIEEPPAGVLEALAQKINKSVQVKLEQDVAELDLPEQQKPGEADKKPSRAKKIQGEQAALLN